MPSNYYNIDSILAEEELIPCTTMGDFSFLSHLDPEISEKQHYLPQNSRVKIPLWAIEKWATLGFVRLSLPRHFSRKARERLEADPSEVDLRKRNERFFMSGCMLVDLIERSSVKVEKILRSQARNTRQNSQMIILQQLVEEAKALRKSLISAYTGDRLRHTMDWSLSSVGDDVSAYTNKLTEMERRLFERGSNAAASHARWTLAGNRRLVNAKAISPKSKRSTDGEESQGKRARTE